VLVGGGALVSQGTMIKAATAYSSPTANGTGFLWSAQGVVVTRDGTSGSAASITACALCAST
jgi:hypothetical protein